MRFPITLLFAFLLLTLAGCSSSTPPITVPESFPQHHLLYLHGQIVEEQGRAAYSERFGRYELDSILAALAAPDRRVYCELRPSGTDVRAYGRRVSGRIDSLKATGVTPERIAVVGASKGAIIASWASTYNTYPVNYVLLAGNNDWQEENSEWNFHGRVLGVHDASDQIAGNDYGFWRERSSTTAFGGLTLNLGLGHGFLYRPYPEWVEPARRWVEGKGL